QCDCLLWCTALDVAQFVGVKGDVDTTIFLAIFNRRTLCGNEQGVIHRVINGLLDLLFDMAEVKDHAFIIQVAVEDNIDNQALADQPAFGAQVGKVDGGHLVNEQGAHGVSVLAAGSLFRDKGRKRALL
ncbi:hypothetical protein ElyMa_006539900, partial [Elysia marginata]